MASDLHHRWVAHGNARDVIQRKRFLVVAQTIGWYTAKSTQRGIDACNDRRQRLIANRQHHAKAAPRQPSTPQPGAPLLHQWPVGVIPLEPQPWFRQPWPKPSTMPVSIHRFRFSHRAPRRALRAAIPHRLELAVGNIGTDVAVAGVDPLLQFFAEWINALVSPLQSCTDLPRVACT